MRPWISRPVTLSVLGAFLIVLGTVLCVFWPALFQHILSKELSLSPTSKSFELWKDTSEMPVHLDFYFFNWTNPEEIKIPGVKPNLVQVGPYSFIEKRSKTNITFHTENSTVSFLQRRFWYFDDENSNGSLRDNITQLNIVALSAVHKVRYWSYFMQTSLSYLLSNLQGIHVTKTVDELLFTGYKDPLIDMGKLAAGTDIPPFDKFGWFYMRNGTIGVDGHYNMATGQDSIKNVGLMRKWDYRDTVKSLNSPCNAVEGSAGEFWPPGLTKDDITLFSADVCRSLTFEYNHTVEYQGIKGYRYVIGDKTLSNSTLRRYPHEQAKYFEPTTTTEDFFASEHSGEVTSSDFPEDPDVVNMGQCFCNGECVPSGLFNVTACRYGAPAFLSLPHFHKADRYYRDQVTGMNPKEEDHSFYITVEPNTGIPLNVGARLQINFLLEPSKSIALFKGVPRIYFPILWFHEHGGLTEELAYPLRQLLLMPSIGLYLSVAMVLLGLLIVLVVGILHLVRRRRGTFVNTKPRRMVSTGQKTELVYLDTTMPNDDTNARGDRALYPKLTDIQNS